MKVAVVGAGWAGMAASVAMVEAGHHATVFEAAPAVGGRARALNASLPDGTPVVLDNGQHILIGAYTQSLRLMAQVGVDPAVALLRAPLSLSFPDGSGLQTPAWAAHWPAPLDALAAIGTARGWTWRDRLSLLRASTMWQRAGFQCDPSISVAALCSTLARRPLQELIEPLCISALNTPATQASAQVFLRVLQDALFGVRGGSHLLLPKLDLTALFPGAAQRWLEARGAHVHTGQRMQRLQWQAPGWQVNDQPFDHVIWATSVSHAVDALTESAVTAPDSIAIAMREWMQMAAALRFESIATAYAWGPGVRLPRPMLALHASAQMPAQFVFDRGQLGNPPGLLAFVVSASQYDRATIQDAVLHQAQQQLGLSGLVPVQTVVEKRATFACTPGLLRPPQCIAPGLSMAGDYIEGPYPATLEGAVRSGLSAARLLCQPGTAGTG